MKIFGREPAVIVGTIEAALVLLLSFGLFDLTQDTIGLIMAVVTAAFGLYLAYVTSETLLAGVLGLIKAVLALSAVYGFALSVEQTGALLAFVSVGFALFQRTQTSPLNTPTFEAIAPDDTTTPKAL
jgi:Na+/H+ antiporter NhaC